MASLQLAAPAKNCNFGRGGGGGGGGGGHARVTLCPGTKHWKHEPEDSTGLENSAELHHLDPKVQHPERHSRTKKGMRAPNLGRWKQHEVRIGQGHCLRSTAPCIVATAPSTHLRTPTFLTGKFCLSCYLELFCWSLRGYRSQHFAPGKPGWPTATKPASYLSPALLEPYKGGV